jgi:esterase/lipase
MYKLASVTSGIDMTVSLGNILTIVSMMVAVISFAFILRSQIKEVALETMDLKEDAKDIKKDLTKITEILIVQGRLDERVTAMDQRMVYQGKRIDDAVRRMSTFLDMRAVSVIEDDEGAEH